MLAVWEQLALPMELETPALPGPRMTRDDQLAAAYGARRLLAVILRQAIYDEAALQAGQQPDRATWPWNGQWTLQEELDAFWQSPWLERMCDELDLDHGFVVKFVQGIRDGTQYVGTDKRRALSVGSPRP